MEYNFSSFINLTLPLSAGKICGASFPDLKVDRVSFSFLKKGIPSGGSPGAWGSTCPHMVAFYVSVIHPSDCCSAEAKGPPLWYSRRRKIIALAVRLRHICIYSYCYATLNVLRVSVETIKKNISFNAVKSPRRYEKRQSVLWDSVLFPLWYLCVSPLCSACLTLLVLGH